MRAPAIFSLDVNTTSELRATAVRLGVPYSTLADLLIRYALTTAPADRLTAWASTVRAGATSKPKDGLKGSESRALAALDSEWTETRVLRTKATLGEKVMLRALEGLAAKGLAEVQVPAGVAKDRDGRPMTMYWRRKG
jgi:hypothetical protein